MELERALNAEKSIAAYLKDSRRDLKLASEEQETRFSNSSLFTRRNNMLAMLFPKQGDLHDGISSGEGQREIQRFCSLPILGHAAMKTPWLPVLSTNPVGSLFDVATHAVTGRLLHMMLHGWAAISKQVLVSSSHLEKVTLLRQNHKLSMVISKIITVWASITASVRQERAHRSHMRDLACRVATQRILRRMETLLCVWKLATQHSRQEAKHRHRFVTMASESSAKTYNFTRETKRKVVELRKQRRAHGVAAIHAGLDRRLQVALHEWFAVVREAQQATAHQLSLDTAAAESAACYVIIRMQNRQIIAVLRANWQAQLLRVIDDGLHLWCFVTFRAWSSIVGSRFEAWHQHD